MGGYRGNWTRIWFEADLDAPVDVPHHEIMRVESGCGVHGLIAVAGDGNCPGCGEPL